MFKKFLLVFSIGRAGTYRYEVDIDGCIEQAEIKNYFRRQI